ncbi:MAG: CpsD/CapB family tyrosine-protein kinase [Thermoleophilia bacterium]
MAIETNDYQLYVKHYPNSAVSEAFRMLRTNLLLTNIDRGLNSLVVTSADRGEGKSTICANLAVIMAQAEKKVLLLDCDLRLPSQGNLFDIATDVGVTTMVGSFGDDRAVEIPQEVMPGLTVIGSGPPPPNPSEFLGSNKFRAFLEHMEKSYDTVIVDAPPVGLVTDAAVLSAFVDGTVLVLDAQSGLRNLALQAKASLEKVNANLIGVILNNVRQERNLYSYYHYRGYQGEE